MTATSKGLHTLSTVQCMLVFTICLTPSHPGLHHQSGCLTLLFAIVRLWTPSAVMEVALHTHACSTSSTHGMLTHNHNIVLPDGTTLSGRMPTQGMHTDLPVVGLQETRVLVGAVATDLCKGHNMDFVKRVFQLSMRIIVDTDSNHHTNSDQCWSAGLLASDSRTLRVLKNQNTDTIPLGSLCKKKGVSTAKTNHPT